MIFQITNLSHLRFLVLKDDETTQMHLDRIFGEGLVKTSWFSFFQTLPPEQIVEATPGVGIFFKSRDTYVSTGRSFPTFTCDEESVIVLFSDYTVSESTYSYSDISGFLRLYPVSYSVEPGVQNLLDIYRKINEVAATLADREDFEQSEKDLAALTSRVNALAQRSNPLETVQSVATDIYSELRTKFATLESQIANLNEIDLSNASDTQNFYNKTYIDTALASITTMLNNKAGAGQLSAHQANSTPLSSFNSHRDNASNPHKVTYSQVGAPSVAQYSDLLQKYNDLESRLDSIESRGYVSSVEGRGGIFVRRSEDGVIVDGAYMRDVLFDETMVDLAEEISIGVTNLEAGGIELYVDGVLTEDFDLDGAILTPDEPFYEDSHIRVIRR